MCLAKVAPTIETVVLNMLLCCQDDLCPLKTPTPDFRDNGHLDKKMSIWIDKCLAKVVLNIERVVLNMLPYCQDDFCPLRLQLQTAGAIVILIRKCQFREKRAYKSCSYH